MEPRAVQFLPKRENSILHAPAELAAPEGSCQQREGHEPRHPQIFCMGHQINTRGNAHQPDRHQNPRIVCWHGCGSRRRTELVRSLEGVATPLPSHARHRSRARRLFHPVLDCATMSQVGRIPPLRRPADPPCLPAPAPAAPPLQAAEGFAGRSSAHHGAAPAALRRHGAERGTPPAAPGQPGAGRLSQAARRLRHRRRPVSVVERARAVGGKACCVAIRRVGRFGVFSCSARGAHIRLGRADSFAERDGHERHLRDTDKGCVESVLSDRNVAFDGFVGEPAVGFVCGLDNGVAAEGR